MDDNFHDLINQNDDLQIAIRCHLVIEYYLIIIIDHYLPVKNEFDIDRLNFKQKVELAISLNGIKKSQKGLLLYMNKLRNMYAHDLEHKISDREISEMYSMLDPDSQSDLSNTGAYPEGSNTRKLGGIYLTLYAALKAKHEILAGNA